MRPAERVVAGAKYKTALCFNPRIMGVGNIWLGDLLNMSVDAQRTQNMRHVKRGVLNEELGERLVKHAVLLKMLSSESQER